MVGKGLLTGMGITLKRFFGKKMTVHYPKEKLPMSERFRGGALDLNLQKCIACGLCSMACPNNVIRLASAVDENKKKYLTKYVYHGDQCIYCNLCLEACPTKAIIWDKNYENACYHHSQLIIDCLAAAKAKAAVNQTVTQTTIPETTPPVTGGRSISG